MRGSAIFLAGVLLIVAMVPAAAPPSAGPPRPSAMARLFDAPAAAEDRPRDQESGERVCIKSFPWPWGGFDDKKFFRYRAQQMKDLRDRLDSITARHQAGDPTLGKDLEDRPGHEQLHHRNLQSGH